MSKTELMFQFPRPWRLSQLDSRVSLVADNGRVITEILPGQKQQVEHVTPDLNAKLAIAKFILRQIGDMR